MIEFNYTLFIQFFEILILLALLNVFLFRPMLKGLTKRSATIKSLYEKAEGDRRHAEDLGKSYEEKMKERKLPILEKRETALKEAHADSMKVIEEARRELVEELAKVKETVRKESETTFAVLLAESDRLALDVAQKITRRGI